jgi:hypothetical protein
MRQSPPRARDSRRWTTRAVLRLGDKRRASRTMAHDGLWRRLRPLRGIHCTEKNGFRREYPPTYQPLRLFRGAGGGIS